MAALAWTDIQAMTVDELESELSNIFTASQVALETKTSILFEAIGRFTPRAEAMAATSAGGSFWQFLMQLLVQFLPLLLRLLGGV